MYATAVLVQVLLVSTPPPRYHEYSKTNTGRELNTTAMPSWTKTILNTHTHPSASVYWSKVRCRNCKTIISSPMGWKVYAKEKHIQQLKSLWTYYQQYYLPHIIVSLLLPPVPPEIVRPDLTGATPGDHRHSEKRCLCNVPLSVLAAWLQHNDEYTPLNEWDEPPHSQVCSDSLVVRKHERCLQG